MRIFFITDWTCLFLKERNYRAISIRVSQRKNGFFPLSSPFNEELDAVAWRHLHNLWLWLKKLCWTLDLHNCHPAFPPRTLLNLPLPLTFWTKFREADSQPITVILRLPWNPSASVRMRASLYLFVGNHAHNLTCVWQVSRDVSCKKMASGFYFIFRRLSKIIFQFGKA